MALKTFVKVSGINNLSDARYCAGMGVNQLGFNIEETHANYTDPQSFKELSDWVSGVEFVGELESLEPKGQIAEIIKDYDLSAIQVANSELIGEAFELGKRVIYYSQNIADAQNIAREHSSQLSYILLEDENMQHDAVKDLAKVVDVVIGTGFDTDNLEDVLQSLQPKGIALKGSDEIRPGFKHFDEMADILEALDADEWV